MCSHRHFRSSFAYATEEKVPVLSKCFKYFGLPVGVFGVCVLGERGAYACKFWLIMIITSSYNSLYYTLIMLMHMVPNKKPLRAYLHCGITHTLTLLQRKLWVIVVNSIIHNCFSLQGLKADLHSSMLKSRRVLTRCQVGRYFTKTVFVDHRGSQKFLMLLLVQRKYLPSLWSRIEPFIVQSGTHIL